MRPRRRNDVVDEGASGSLEIELGSWSAMTSDESFAANGWKSMT